MNLESMAAHRGQRPTGPALCAPKAWSVPPDAFDEREWQEIVRIAVANIHEADRTFRSTHRGDDLEEIIDAFQICGPLVDLPPAALLQYARAVSEGLPFELLPDDAVRPESSD